MDDTSEGSTRMIKEDNAYEIEVIYSGFMLGS